MFDYEMLRLVWWVLVGVLLIGFAITDGFDMGVGALLPFVGKKDVERRVMLNTMGPHWEGNQVWLVTAGGALFAAWPMVYAAASAVRCRPSCLAWHSATCCRAYRSTSTSS